MIEKGDSIVRRTILVVDDIEINRIILEELFSGEYDVIEAENGQVALDKIHEYGTDIAIVLLDIVMPVMDGFAVLSAMAAENLLDTIPVIMITGESDDSKMLNLYGYGVSDVVSKPFNPEIVERRVKNVVALYNHKAEMEEKLKEQKEMLDDQAKKLREFDQYLIDVLSTTVEFRDNESGQHINRVRALTRFFLTRIRNEYPLTDEQINVISNVSAMHDIGKIAISDSILLKPGRLTPEEFEVMKTHTVKGCEILQAIGDAQDLDYYEYSYDICRHHHEKWDGKGYPDGLKGDEISIWAQAVSVADVYDALTNARVYKPAKEHEEAVRMIVNGECGTFNPVLIECLLRCEEELKHSLEKYK